MLYLGWFFLISEFSRRRASDSDWTTTCSILSIFLTRFMVFRYFIFFWKYDFTLFLRLIAFPTYIIFLSLFKNWYTPGNSGIVLSINLDVSDTWLK